MSTRDTPTPDAVSNCGKCGKALTDSAEFCWYCHGRLCYECWDVIGHCGHAEADRINKEAEARGGANNE